MEKLSSKILGRIKQENMRPKSRWYFFAMNSLLIAMIAFSIIVGSMAVAIVIRHFSWTEWELLGHLANGKFKSLLVLLPYLWLIFILFAIFLADQLFKYTKIGYRWRSGIIVLGSMLLSLNFGYILYLAKLDRPFERALVNKIPFYQSWEKERDQLFAAPEMGVLAGRIIKIKSEHEWVLLDFANKKWLIHTEDAKVKNNFHPITGVHVGVIGQRLDENHFQAKNISPWKKQIFLPPPSLIEMKIEKF